jgi:uncharacterized membrane protein YdjX (TVP38/TMEM64 family)
MHGHTMSMQTHAPPTAHPTSPHYSQFEARNNWAGWGIFIGMYTGMVALFLPAVVFIAGAGFVFGFWKGLLAVWIGGAAGQALAFLLARYLIKDWVESFVARKWAK